MATDSSRRSLRGLHKTGQHSVHWQARVKCTVTLTQTETDRQRDRQTETETDRQTETETDRQRQTDRDRQTETETDTDTETDRQTETNGTLFCGHASQRECAGVVCVQAKPGKHALCKSDVYTQVDTPPQLSQSVDSIDEAKTVPTAYNKSPSYL